MPFRTENSKGTGTENGSVTKVATETEIGREMVTEPEGGIKIPAETDIWRVVHQAMKMRDTSGGGGEVGKKSSADLFPLLEWSMKA